MDRKDELETLIDRALTPIDGAPSYCQAWWAAEGVMLMWARPGTKLGLPEAHETAEFHRKVSLSTGVHAKVLLADDTVDMSAEARQEFRKFSASGPVLAYAVVATKPVARLIVHLVRRLAPSLVPFVTFKDVVTALAWAEEQVASLSQG